MDCRKLVLFGVAVLAGCHASPPTPNASSPKPSTDPKLVLTLDGPGGKVSIGDPLGSAKKAFPAPNGAHIFDRPMSLALVAKEGYCWAEDAGQFAFEAATERGKIVGMVLTEGKGDGKEPAKTVASIGPPTKKAESENGALYVWDCGENARFWMGMRGKNSIFGNLSATMVGRKADLKLLNYRADDPETFVKQLDASAQQMNSPELKKAFEDAKKKAIAKRK